MTKLAVVSGGGTGIGAATAQALAGDGYDVLIVGRRGDVLDSTATRINTGCGRAGAVTWLVADLTDPAQVTRVAETVGDRTVDVLVNNAGGYRARASHTGVPDAAGAADAPGAADAADAVGAADAAGAAGAPGRVAASDPSVATDLASLADQWQANYAANVISAVLLTEALTPALRRPGGRVILVSSIAAQRGGDSPYSAAKAALHGWAYALAAELGPEQITVNVISPGYVVETEFFDGRMTPEGHARRVAATLVKRPGEPAEVAAAVSYLASPAAGYVTGQVLGVNGGSVFGR